MTLHHTLTLHIQKAVQELFGIAIEKVEFQATRKEFEGDITMVVFPLVKALKGNPVEIGNQIGNYLVTNVNEVSKFNVLGCSVATACCTNDILRPKHRRHGRGKHLFGVDCAEHQRGPDLAVARI